jgi:excisionase family DNA binding protein
MPRVDLPWKTVLTVSEVSHYLRVHPSTIYRMLRRHQLPAFRVGSDWRFTVEALDKWLNKADSEVLAGRTPSSRAQ